MFRTVLVPLDGSWFAESALPTAARFAKDAGAKLSLVLVHEPAPALIGMGDVVLPSRDLDFEWRSRQQSYLAATAADASTAWGVSAGFLEIDGNAGPSICEAASRISADLVVMATHGRGALRRLWLGSVADYVVRHLTVPVLLVHPDREAGLRGAPSSRGILVALDLSKDAEAILDPVVTWARTTGAALTLVHVVELVFENGHPGVPGPILPDARLQEVSRATAQERLDRIAARLRRLGVMVATKVIIGAAAAGGLLDLLREDEFDLIAMTTHGHGGMQRLLLGSVADKVIRGTTKPVLVLRPPRLVF
jgi:nucleotide-binding universal stress UspA family protein